MNLEEILITIWVSITYVDSYKQFYKMWMEATKFHHKILSVFFICFLILISYTIGTLDQPLIIKLIAVMVLEAKRSIRDINRKLEDWENDERGS